MSADLLDYIAETFINVHDEVADLLKNTAPYVGTLAALGDLSRWDNLEAFVPEKYTSEEARGFRDRCVNLLRKMPVDEELMTADRQIDHAIEWGKPASPAQIRALVGALVAVLRPTGKFNRPRYTVIVTDAICDTVGRPTPALLAGAIRNLIFTRSTLPPCSDVLAAIRSERETLRARRRQINRIIVLRGNYSDPLIALNELKLLVELGCACGFLIATDAELGLDDPAITLSPALNPAPVA